MEINKPYGFIFIFQEDGSVVIRFETAAVIINGIYPNNENIIFDAFEKLREIEKRNKEKRFAKQENYDSRQI